MNLRFILLFLVLGLQNLSAQSKLSVYVTDSDLNEPLFGASVFLKNTSIGASVQTDGYATIENIPYGNYTLLVSFVGYETFRKSITLDTAELLIIEVQLVQEEDMLDLIVVEGTRSNRSLKNTPTRVEVLTDEIEEAAIMDPSKISHLLSHSTGIQIQQTSATSNTANVRIQGLDGRYTQILKDGFPLYGGFSGSLSIMQIPPLDLRQVEFIKGGASTLYGGGAIAGLINIISKEPTTDEAIIHLNYSNVGAIDVNTFFSTRKEKSGFTLLAQRNTHDIFDADKDGFSDLPEIMKYNIQPRVVFYIDEQQKLSLSSTFTQEKRRGGDLTFLRNIRAFSPEHFYSEENESNRITSQIRYDFHKNESTTFTLKNGVNYFDRTLRMTPRFEPVGYEFSGIQRSTFSEATLTKRIDKTHWISGLNFYTDDFSERRIDQVNLRNEYFQTAGVFTNYTTDFGEKWSVESGLRMDYVFNEDVHLLPRLSALYRWSDAWSTRMGGGLGYRNPSVFNQEAEMLAYQNVLPIDLDNTRAEESIGGNLDFNYRVRFDSDFNLQWNQMFFVTRLNHPLVLVPTADQQWKFINAQGYTLSQGMETFLRMNYQKMTVFIGYTYTDARQFFDENNVVPLTPKHSIKGDVLYTIEEKWRFGMDFEYKGAQYLTDGRKTTDFWTFGAMAEYKIGPCTLFINTENWFDFRQTRKESLLSGPNNTPQLTEVWAPLDGFVYNFGVRWIFK